MNDTPTSGPISSRKIHQARDAMSSRHSFASSHRSSFAAHAAAAQEHEPIAHT
jgi:hypothetical protein